MCIYIYRHIFTPQQFEGTNSAAKPFELCKLLQHKPTEELQLPRQWRPAGSPAPGQGTTACRGHTKPKTNRVSCPKGPGTNSTNSKNQTLSCGLTRLRSTQTQQDRKLLKHISSKSLKSQNENFWHTRMAGSEGRQIEVTRRSPMSIIAIPLLSLAVPLAHVILDCFEV